MRTSRDLTPTVERRLRLPELRSLCSRYAVRRLTAIGSVLDRRFNGDSDIDLVVEFGPSAALSRPRQYFDFVDHAEHLLGRHVDLICRGAIENPVFRQIVEQQEVELFAA